jgi:hypothetical protein
MFFIFVQGIALLALLFHVASFHGKSRARILIVQIIAMSLWVLHFSLLCAWTGTLIVSVGIVVAVCLLNKDKWRFVNTWIFTTFVFVVQAVATALVWEGIFSIFALFGVWTATISRWQTKEQRIRVLAMVASVFWISYDLSVESYGGFLAELAIIGSSLLSLRRR